MFDRTTGEMVDRGAGARLHPDQLGLLTAVALGEVFRVPGRLLRAVEDVRQPSDMTTDRSPVGEAIAALDALGLVVMCPASHPAVAGGDRVHMWDVTERGREVLRRDGAL